MEGTETLSVSANSLLPLDISERSISRKRTRNEDQWKRSVSKQKRNTGESYVSIKTRKDVPARHIGGPCGCHCFDKVGMIKIENVFKEFWEIGDYNLQNAYLSRLLTIKDVKRTRVKDRQSRTSRRIHYSILSDNQTYDVCRKAFYSIHGIGEKRVRNVLKKSKSTGTVTTDQRGKKKEAANKAQEIDVSEVLECNQSMSDTRSKNTRESYVSIKAKKNVPAHHIGGPCNCHCFDKVGMDKIENVFKEFLEIGDYNLQNAYLSKLLSIKDVKRSIVKDRQSRTSRRIHYSIISNNQTYDVCRKAFYSIHGIGEKRVCNVLKKTKSTGTVTTDQCGKKKEAANKAQEIDVSEVPELDQSVPDARNRAKSSNCKYLQVELNISELHSLYKEWFKEE